MAERLRRGRHAQLRGPLLPWTRAPYGYLLDAERPRDPSRVRLEPGPAAVVEPMVAGSGAPGQPVSLDEVAKRLSEAQLPPPRGGTRWNVASVRGLFRSPVYLGIAASGRTRPAPARRRTSALQPVGPGQSEPPAPADAWRAVPGRPASARRPAQPCRSVWIATSRGPAATTRPMSIDCVGLCAVGNVGGRGVAAPCLLAPMMTAVGAAPRRCGSPSARAAPRALRLLEPWTIWSGRISPGTEKLCPDHPCTCPGSDG